GNLLARMNDIPTGVRLLEQALALAEALDDPAEIAECCACLTVAHAWAGELQRALTDCQHRLEAARRCHDLYQMRHVFTNRANLHAMQGRWAEAEAQRALARPVVERLESAEPLAFLRSIEGAVAFDHGDYATAERVFTSAMRTFRALGPAVLIWYLGQ